MRNAIHRVSIPNMLDVNYNMLSKVGVYIKKYNFSNVLIFYGEGIKKLFGDEIENSIKSSVENLKMLKSIEFDNNEIHSLINMAFSIPANTDLIIGVGGGRVLDVAKYISFLSAIPFLSIPTSTSNDGFSSSGCSLMINGKRTSVHAKMPFGILVDLNVIKNSPEKFIYSGIGDLISKVTAIKDWIYEEQNNKTNTDDFAVMISKKSVSSIVKMDFVDIKDEIFLKELVDSLTMSGIAMEIAGNSSPASGSEHLISHACDKLFEKPQLHGIQVGIATYLVSILQNESIEVVRNFLIKTGFFEYVKSLNILKKDFQMAIDFAPSIKPNRFTFIHNDKMREKAKELIYEDQILCEILK